MAKKEGDSAEIKCPLCQIVQCLADHGQKARSSSFVQHLKNAHVELLMAVRSVIDNRIDELKKGPEPKQKPRRIEVEAKGETGRRKRAQK